MNKNDVLDKAKTIINGERQGTYGNAEDNFASIAAFLIPQSTVQMLPI